ncbi:MAG: hypothetical protein NVS3B18_13900 [Candidatus Dormibacteria bacterium]
MCVDASLFFQVTVVPLVMDSGVGLKAKSLMSTVIVPLAGAPAPAAAEDEVDEDPQPAVVATSASTPAAVASPRRMAV